MAIAQAAERSRQVKVMGLTEFDREEPMLKEHEMPASLEPVVGEIYTVTTTTGSFKIIALEHMNKMKNNAIVGNIGHYDKEVEMEPWRSSLASKWGTTCRRSTSLCFPDGHGVIVLATGRLHNLGCATDHPSLCDARRFHEPSAWPRVAKREEVMEAIMTIPILHEPGSRMVKQVEAIDAINKIQDLVARIVQLMETQIADANTQKHARRSLPIWVGLWRTHARSRKTMGQNREMHTYLAALPRARAVRCAGVWSPAPRTTPSSVPWFLLRVAFSPGCATGHPSFAMSCALKRNYDKLAPEIIMFHLVLERCAEQHRVDDPLHMLSDVSRRRGLATTYNLYVICEWMSDMRSLLKWHDTVWRLCLAVP